jgi:hypothetical protein
MAWVQNYNEYIINSWSEKVQKQGEDIDGISDIVDFDEVEVA